MPGIFDFLANEKLKISNVETGYFITWVIQNEPSKFNADLFFFLNTANDKSIKNLETLISRMTIYEINNKESKERLKLLSQLKEIGFKSIQTQLQNQGTGNLEEIKFDTFLNYFKNQENQKKQFKLTQGKLSKEIQTIKKGILQQKLDDDKSKKCLKKLVNDYLKIQDKLDKEISIVNDKYGAGSFFLSQSDVDHISAKKSVIDYLIKPVINEINEITSEKGFPYTADFGLEQKIQCMGDRINTLPEEQCKQVLSSFYKKIEPISSASAPGEINTNADYMDDKGKRSALKAHSFNDKWFFTFLSQWIQTVKESLGIKTSAEILLENSVNEVKLTLEKNKEHLREEKKQLPEDADKENNPLKFNNPLAILGGNKSSSNDDDPYDTSDECRHEYTKEQRFFISQLIERSLNNQWEDWINDTPINPIVKLCLEKKISDKEAVSALNSMGPDSYLEKIDHSNGEVSYRLKVKEREIEIDFLKTVLINQFVKGVVNSSLDIKWKNWIKTTGGNNPLVKKCFDEDISSEKAIAALEEMLNDHDQGEIDYLLQIENEKDLMDYFSYKVTANELPNLF